MIANAIKLRVDRFSDRKGGHLNRSATQTILRDTMRGIKMKKKFIRDDIFKHTKITADGCIVFQRALHYGYGAFGDGKKKVLAHRYIWEQQFGPIPKGMCVCHKCDNPPCINIDHLFLGTQRDNLADRDKKGRTAKGERNGGAKLTEKQVRKIKDSLFTTSFLAKEYGVCPNTIRNIKRGKRWKHLFQRS